ncbi:DUF1531-domain-containing protein [Xylaria sp. CBS 124048]|nr:DUF1531-domain-containing protein [Xylaria sp. CBS 124048]
MADELTGLIVHLGDSTQKLVTLIADRLTNNVSMSFTNMTLQQWIRLVAIVGAYALLRPYVIKMGAKHQEKQFAKAQEEDIANITPNELRGQLQVPEESDDDDDEQGESTGADWGKKARQRQRRMIKQLLDAEEKRLQETLDEQEDKDIEEFLVG